MPRALLALAAALLAVCLGVPRAFAAPLDLFGRSAPAAPRSLDPFRPIAQAAPATAPAPGSGPATAPAAAPSPAPSSAAVDQACSRDADCPENTICDVGVCRPFERRTNILYLYYR